MTWPVSGNWETRTPGTTTVKAAWADALDAALNGLYGGTRSVVGLTIDGSGYASVTPGALTVKRSFTNWSLVSTFDDTLGNTHAQRRLYMGGTSGTESLFAITVNAYWNSGTSRWVADEAGLASSRTLFGSDASSGVLNLYWKVAGAAPWTDGSWTAISIQGNAGLQQLLGDIRATAGAVRGVTVTADSGLTVSSGGANISGTTSLGGGDLVGTGDVRPNSNNNGSIGTALLSFKRIFSYQYIGVVQTIPAAASITIDPTAGETVRITLSATTITAVTISAGQPGQILTVEVIEDGTGNRGIVGSSWTNVLLAGNSYTVTTTANKRDALTFRYDSTSSLWIEIARSMNL